MFSILHEAFSHKMPVSVKKSGYCTDVSKTESDIRVLWAVIWGGNLVRYRAQNSPEIPNGSSDKSAKVAAFANIVRPCWKVRWPTRYADYRRLRSFSLSFSLSLIPHSFVLHRLSLSLSFRFVSPLRCAHLAPRSPLSSSSPFSCVRALVTLLQRRKRVRSPSGGEGDINFPSVRFSYFSPRISCYLGLSLVFLPLKQNYFTAKKISRVREK